MIRELGPELGSARAELLDFEEAQGPALPPHST
jgi:hypothetical protein